MTAKETPIQKLVRVSGGSNNLTTKLKVSRQFVNLCLQRGWFPPKRAAKLEELYGIPRKKLMNPELLQLLG